MEPSSAKKLSASSANQIAGVGVCCFVAGCLLSYAAQQRSLEKSRWVSHTHEVIAKLHETFLALAESESNQRGYLITRDQKLRERHIAAAQHARQAMDQLTQLTKDNLQAQEIAARLRDAIQSKITTMETLIALDARERGKVANLLNSVGSVPKMEAVRSLVDEFASSEHKLLTDRERGEATSERNANLITLLTSLLGFGLILAALAKLRRDLAARAGAEETALSEATRLNAIARLQNELGAHDRSVAEIMDVITKNTMQLTGADGAVIEIVHGDLLVYEAVAGSMSTSKGASVKTDSSLSGIAVRTREVQLCEDSETDARVDRDACRRLGVRSMLIAPLFKEDRTMGVLKVCSAHPAVFGEKQRMTLSFMAGLLAAAIGRASDFEMRQRALAEKTEVLGHLSRINEVLLGFGTEATLNLERILNAALIELGGSRAFYCRLGESGKVEVAASIGDGQGRGLTDLEEKVALDAISRDQSEPMISLPNTERLCFIAQSVRSSGRAFGAICVLVKEPEPSISAQRYLGVLGIAIGIEDERRLLQAELHRAREKALEGSYLKSQFLANMSHEIRTPMNGIIGMTSVMSNTQLTAEQREHLGLIGKSADSLLSLINDILDFSKIESNKIDIEVVDFNLAKLVSEACELLSFQAKEKSITLTLDISSDLPSVLRGDPTRLRQVINNLVANAIKFTERGTVRITVALVASEGPIRRVRLAVIDTGIGIPEAALNRIFYPFSQGDLSTTRKYGGTGLGLSISSRLVRLMHGELLVKSTPGKGSTFYFELPLEQGSDGAVKAQNANRDFAGIRPTLRGNVLVVEDNPINQKVAEAMLKQMGFMSSLAGNGREALDMLARDRFDLVLMDCQMPVMDGYTCAESIRALHDPLIKDLPIIAMTANAIKGDRERCLAAGMNDHISKPIDALSFERTLSRWLGEGSIDKAPPIVLHDNATNTYQADARTNAIDIAAIRNLKSFQSPDDPQLVSELVGMFLATSPERIERMRSAIAASDAHALANEAHSLKSSAANLGALALRDTCAELEILGEKGELSNATSLLEKALGQFERARTELTDLAAKGFATYP